MQKRGSFILGQELIYMIGRVAVVTIVTIFLIFLLNNYVHREITTDQLESNLILSRAIYAPNCFSYSDEAKSYPGIIDSTKFNDNVANSCMNNKNIGIKLSITDLSDTLISEVNVNNDIIEDWPLCQVKRKKFTCNTESSYILLKKDNELMPAKLKLEVLNKNA